MKQIIISLLSVFIAVFAYGQSEKIPKIRPLFSFDIGIVGNSMSSMTDDLEQYTGVEHFLNASLLPGLNAGIYIGERHKLAFTYSTSLNTRHDGYIQSNIFSSGFWYQYKILKNKPLFVQLGFTETIANLYVTNKNASPVTENGTLNQYLNDNSSFIIANFEQWTNGCNLSVLYSFINTSLLQMNGQIGYLLNFDHGSWQYMHNNGERNNNSKLPKDNLNGLFLKLVFEFDFVKSHKTKAHSHGN